MMEVELLCESSVLSSQSEEGMVAWDKVHSAINQPHDDQGVLVFY